MISSEGIVVFLALVLSPAAVAAQDAEAVDLYNDATAAERRALRAAEGSEARIEAIDRCLSLAVESFGIQPSRLAAWRVVSCAELAGDVMTGWVGALAFDLLEPEHLAGWTHRSIEEDERERVVAWREELERRVGAVRLRGADGASVVWLVGGHSAWVVDVPAGGISLVRSTTFVRIGNVVFAPTGTSATMVVTRSGGASPEARSVSFRSLGEGVTDLDLAEGSDEAAAVEPADLPDAPTRDDVHAAITAIYPDVVACAPGLHGVAPVAITIEGATGRVTSVVVTGEFAGTPVGSCIGRVVRRAEFPRFRRERFTVNYPLRI